MTGEPGRAITTFLHPIRSSTSPERAWDDPSRVFLYTLFFSLPLILKPSNSWIILRSSHGLLPTITLVNCYSCAPIRCILLRGSQSPALCEWRWSDCAAPLHVLVATTHFFWSVLSGILFLFFLSLTSLLSVSCSLLMLHLPVSVLLPNLPLFSWSDLGLSYFFFSFLFFFSVVDHVILFALLSQKVKRKW